MPLPVKGTRLEQARALEEHVFGPAPEKPSPVVDGALMGAPVPVECPLRPGSDTEPLVPGGGRREHSTGTGLALVPLAAAANGHVFDVAEPTPEEVDAFWADVETARQRIRSQQGFWQRLRGDVSLRTFRDHLPTAPASGPPAAAPRAAKAEPRPPGDEPATTTRRRHHRRPAPRALGRHEREETREAEVRPPLRRPRDRPRRDDGLRHHGR